MMRRKIAEISAAFVLGFVALYTLAGALIGAAGHHAQLLFAEYSRAVAFASGVIVILLGLWVGFRGRTNAAAACPMPSVRAMQTMSRRDAAGSLIASMGYALGCTACFGGAIVGTLLVYVGAIGSAAIGAGIMLTFAIGVAVPFLLAAYYMSRVDSILAFLAGHSRVLSFASMAVIVAFGLVLATDNFHTVSDAIYPYLGLSSAP
jgi:cytochrome c-type biogenesis protein